jgi:hypothetical protein
VAKKKQIDARLKEAMAILKALDLPEAQQNERSALTLLALLGLAPDQSWSEVDDPLCGITPMMQFFAKHYNKRYAPNTRETVRRQTIHQFQEAGLIVADPDDVSRAVNSPKAAYQIEPSTLKLIRGYGTADWDRDLVTWKATVQSLKTRYAQAREMTLIPVTLPKGQKLNLSPGGQNILVKQIIEAFASRFTPGGKLLYVGDAENKFALFDKEGLQELGVEIDPHGKIPDVIIYFTAKDWLVLVEAVTSHGPIDGKRLAELKRLFSDAKPGLVFVTAFLDRKAMVGYLDQISWETEVWAADSPTHMIHFNGERFLRPYPMHPGTQQTRNDNE